MAIISKKYFFSRARRSRVRTVPSSRANSSKQSKLELEPVVGKRSRSASEDPLSALGHHVSHAPAGHVTPASAAAHAHTNGPLEVRGTESLKDFFTPSPEDSPALYTSAHAHTRGHMTRPRRLAKVETIRVLRARSALLLPLPSPAIPSLPSSLSCQPLILKSEDRKKKRR